MHYRIRVKGHLDLSWQSWFAPLQIEHEAAGMTVLSGILPDQAALYGVLLKIHRLGLPLLGLNSDETFDKFQREKNMNNQATNFPQTYQIQFDFQFEVTQRLLDLARTLPADVYHSKQGYSHDSIHNTFCHIIGAAKFWRGVIVGTLPPDFDPSDPVNIADIAGLVLLLESERNAWYDLLATFDEATLLGSFKSDSPIGPRLIPLWRTLQHVVLHTMQHQTELARMLTEAGQPPGDIDFFWDEAAT